MIKAKVDDNRLTRQLYEYNGLLQTKLKVPIHDTFMLSIVYSPGVGEPCLKIQEDNELAYVYTNIGNNIALLTDGSDFPFRDDPRWNDFAVLPILEQTSLFYKRIAFIDAQPYLLSRECQTEEQYKNVVLGLQGGVAGIMLFLMKHEIEEKIQRGLQNSHDKMRCFILTSREKETLIQKLKDSELDDKINFQYYLGILCRALLDTLYRGFIQTSIWDVVFHNINPQLFIDNPLSYLHNHSFQIYKSLVQHIFEKNLQNTKNTQVYLLNRFQNFLVIGGKSWYPSLDTNYPRDGKPAQLSLDLHKNFQGVMNLGSKVKTKSDFKISQLVNKDIQDYLTMQCLTKPNFYKEMTMKTNWCAIITNGTAILGFGDIGATAGMPVMEGKSCIFKGLGDVDVIPVCIQEKDPKKLIEIICHISPIFSAINLEDIKAPECFIVEEELKKRLNIPVFHDDQHGTAIVVVSGVLNSLRLLKKQPKDIKVIVNGGGAAGLSITHLLIKIGVQELIVCDTKGAIYEGRQEGMNDQKVQIAQLTNKNKVTGKLEHVLKGCDVFIGVSAGGALKKEWIPNMNKNPIIMALANPDPEIYPNEAFEAGAYIVGTGRSDFPNQINNSLAFPGIFRGVLDSEASEINLDMKLAAARAIAELIPESKLRTDYVVPNCLDPKVSLSVAFAVAEAAFKTGVARRQNIDLDTIKRRMSRRILGQIPEPGNYGWNWKL